MPYLIDGNNVLWMIHKNDERFAPLDQKAFCGQVSRYLALIRDPGEIVFDGSGPRDRAGLGRHSGLRIVFAGQDIEADAVIEDKIRLCPSPRKLWVVSSDRRVRRAASLRRAQVLKAEEFWETVQKRLARKTPTPEPQAKRHGLSEGEAEHWLKEFGLDRQDRKER